MTTTEYTVQYERGDHSVPGLVRRQLLSGLNREGTEEVVTFLSLEAAQNAAGVQRSQRGVLRAYVLPVREGRLR